MARQKHIPELLLPAGNTEAFFAAKEGGADAVYLGLKQFNARERAVNFSYSELIALLDEADKNGMKVYLTLNTVIKNKEIPALLDTLYALSQTHISAIIIQDWGVYQLVRKHFSKLKIHGSTQMGNHNSLGAIYSEQKGFERVIFARELTQQEIAAITKKSAIQVEMFVHGALCYSLSGMCLFSSYLGGRGANRGMCMQPCRRMYQDGQQKHFIFSLKDNELINYMPQIKSMGVASLKIEARLKPAEYVFQVTKAYRTALDSPENIEKARELIQDDLGREKTSYFFGGSVKEAITDNPSTGKYLGKASNLTSDSFELLTPEKLDQGNRLWIRSPKGENRSAIKIKSLKQKGTKQVVFTDMRGVQPGDQVYLANFRQMKFPSRFEQLQENIKPQLPPGQKKKIESSLGKPKKLNKSQVFVRIDSIKWLKKIPFQQIDNLILNFSEREWKELDVQAFLLKKNAHKIFFELPKFIPEEKIEFYQSLLNGFHKAGYKNFMISHLSQKLIIPNESIIAANENVYIFNDAAVQFLQQEHVKLYCYPQENDMDNLFSMRNQKGIIPVYFYPELFYSRMPVKIKDKNHHFADDKNYHFTRKTKNGMTLVIPDAPVSLTQYKHQLEKKGFGRYLIDLSWEKPSDNRLRTIIKSLHQSKQLQPSTTFNFKKGLA